MDPITDQKSGRSASTDAQTKALRFGHTEVDAEHLLLALLDQAEGIAPRGSARPARTRTGCAPRWRPSSAAAQGHRPRREPRAA